MKEVKGSERSYRGNAGMTKVDGRYQMSNTKDQIEPLEKVHVRSACTLECSTTSSSLSFSFF